MLVVFYPRNLRNGSLSGVTIVTVNQNHQANNAIQLADEAAHIKASQESMSVNVSRLNHPRRSPSSRKGGGLGLFLFDFFVDMRRWKTTTIEYNYTEGQSLNISWQVFFFSLSEA